MKKQIFNNTNKFFPLIIIIILSLAFVTAYSLRNNLKNGTIYLKTLEGDSSAIDDITITGSIFDSLESLDFKIEKGNITKKLVIGRNNSNIQKNSLNNREVQFGEYQYSTQNYYTSIDDSINTSMEEEENTVYNDSIGINRFQQYTYNTNKIQPLISIQLKNNQNKIKEKILLTDCYIYSEEIGLNIKKYILYDKENNIIDSYINLVNRPRSFNIKNLVSIGQNIYYIIPTNKQYRDTSGIYKLNDFYSDIKIDDYFTANETNKEINDSDIKSGYEKLIDIDLKDGNTCVYGMEVIGDKIAVLVSNTTNVHTINYQVWLFDSIKKEFVSKQSIIESSEEFKNINIFVQEDFINFYFLDPNSIINIITIDNKNSIVNKISDNSFSFVDKTKDIPTITGNINNIFYKNNNTYINISEQGEDMIVVFSGINKKYTGQIMSDRYMDYDTNDNHSAMFINEIREISIIGFK